MKRTNKIFALATTFVLGIAVTAPLFAQVQEAIKSEQAAVTDTINEAVRIEQLPKVKQEPMMDHMSNLKQEKTDASMLMIITFGDAINRKDAATFDRFYKSILGNGGQIKEDYLKLTLILTFGLFDYTGTEEEKTPLVAAMSGKTSDSIDTFMQLYKEIKDADRQTILEDTFSKFKLNETGRKILPTRKDLFLKKN